MSTGRPSRNTARYSSNTCQRRDFRVHSPNLLANLLTQRYRRFFRHYDLVRLCSRSPFSLGRG
jgi:hypothetical protein